MFPKFMVIMIPNCFNTLASGFQYRQFMPAFRLTKKADITFTLPMEALVNTQLTLLHHKESTDEYLDPIHICEYAPVRIKNNELVVDSIRKDRYHETLNV